MDGFTHEQVAALRVASGRTHHRHAHVAARDGRHLFYLAHKEFGPATGILYVIDLATDTVLRTHAGLPLYSRPDMIERGDGVLVLCSSDHLAGQARFRLTRLHPFTGERQDEFLPEPVGDRARKIHEYSFRSISPKGRFLLRFDHTRLPMRPGQDGLPEFGVSLQVWESGPLRCIGRNVVRWTRLIDLPRDHRFERVEGPDGRRMVDVAPPDGSLAMWTMLSELLARFDLAPNDAFPPRSAFPKPFLSDDAAWANFLKKYDEVLSLQCPSTIRWQPDEQAFWFKGSNTLTCAGPDGSLSPTWVARLPESSGKNTRLTMDNIEILSDRKARVTFRAASSSPRRTRRVAKRTEEPGHPESP